MGEKKKVRKNSEWLLHQLNYGYDLGRLGQKRAPISLNQAYGLTTVADCGTVIYFKFQILIVWADQDTTTNHCVINDLEFPLQGAHSRYLRINNQTIANNIVLELNLTLSHYNPSYLSVAAKDT